MEIAELSELKNVERSFGTPSAQKIIQILTCWETVTVKQLSEITELSESQIHATLQSLIEADIVKRESRGNYTLSDSPFAQELKVAYNALLERVLGKFMHNLTTRLDDMSPDEISTRLDYMIKRWKPMMEKLYRSKLSSLAEYIIDRY
jgi:transcriptional antiterminator